MREMTPEEKAELDQLLADHRRQIHASLEEAEDHLGVRRGTLTSIQADGDFMFVMKMTTTMEPLLNDALRGEIKGGLKKLKAEHEGANALAEFVADAYDTARKLKLAAKLGIIQDRRLGFCRTLFELRNRYAHHASNMHLSIWEIISTKFPADQRKNAFSNLTYGEKIDDVAPGFHNSQLRLGSFYQFADFVADALRVLKPTPFRGLLGLGPAANER